MVNNPESSSQKPKNNISDSSPIVPQPISSNALELIRQAGLQLGTKLSLVDLSSDLLELVYQLIPSDYILLLTRDTDGINFRYQNRHPALNDRPLTMRLKKVFLNSFNAQGDPIIGQWLQNTATTVTKDDVIESQVRPILDILQVESLHSIPMLINDKLSGILLFKLTDEQPIPSETVEILNILSPHLAMYLDNACQAPNL
jgi:GAF domain-containing protein